MPLEGFRPWLSAYPARMAALLELPSSRSLVDVWKRRVAGGPGLQALRYFDGSLTAQELDVLSDALAVVLQDRGVTRGDRVGVRLQNVPHFPVSLTGFSGHGWCGDHAALLAAV